MPQLTLSTLGDPLPQRFLVDSLPGAGAGAGAQPGAGAGPYPGAGVGGRLKVRPEDFLVDEIPLYEPCGEGEHVYLRVQKTNVPHAELLAAVRKAFGVTDRAIGFAGMKDKHGVTQQTISIHLPKREVDAVRGVDLKHGRIAVLWTSRHRNKLRTGHLKGNRFSIRIREVDPLKAPLVMKALRMMEQRGVPNYFGPQRFGYRRNNHVMGALALRGQWKELLDELLGRSGAPFPEYQARRRKLYEQGQFAEAMAEWTIADRAEMAALKALSQGASATEACRRMGKYGLTFFVNAFQSAVFNRLLDRRLDEGKLDVLEEGDLAWRHDRRHVFRVTAEELATGELPGRLERLEVSPTGPLWGSGMTRAGGAVDAAECEALQSTGLSVEEVVNSRRSPTGARRPMREQVTNATADSGFDEHGPFIRVAFDLPRGVYATVLLREIMRTDDGLEASHDTDWE